MNREILIMTVRRPEIRVRNVRERAPSVGGNFRQAVNGLSAVGISEEIVAGVIQRGVLLQIIRPVGNVDRRIGAFIGLDRILVDG